MTEKKTKTLKKKERTSQYKWIKHMYAELDEIKKVIKEHEKEIYELKLRYGKLARRIKKLELKE